MARGVSKNTRIKVFERDGYKCVYPNCKMKKPVLTIDHIIPISKGGTNEFNNLQTLCKIHNSRKGDQIINYIKPKE